MPLQITRFSFGTPEAVELIPGGVSKPVTMENRKEYVSAYVNYVLNKSIEEPFKAFANGFMNVCNGRVLVGVVKSSAGGCGKRSAGGCGKRSAGGCG